MTDQASTPAQFRSFFDDAATFPPGLSPLPDAVAAHLARRRRPLADAVGPAIWNLADLDEAQRLVRAKREDDDAPVRVSVVTPAGELGQALAAVDRHRPELEIVSIELKTDPDDEQVWRSQIAEAAQAQAAGAPGIFVELTEAQVRSGGLEALSEGGLRLKYRTGGIKAELFPTPEQLASVLMAAIKGGVPFKLTAGLHEAVRYTNDTTGFTHHGFLNIAMAVEAAQRGESAERVAELLTTTDADELASAAAGSDAGWRRAFTSFGTCSVGEPAESLERLDLFPAGLH